VTGNAEDYGAIVFDGRAPQAPFFKPGEAVFITPMRIQIGLCVKQVIRILELDPRYFQY
jgi:hypothetical protein